MKSNAVGQKIFVWVREHIVQIVVLMTLFSVLTFLSISVPYVNILLTSKMIAFFVLLAWYMLFPPSIALVVFLSLGALGAAWILTIFRFKEIAESSGEFVFILLIFILIRYLKDMTGREKQ